LVPVTEATEEIKPVDPTILRMKTLKRVSDGSYVPVYTDVSLPEHMQVLKPGAQYVAEGEIGIV